LNLSHDECMRTPSFIAILDFSTAAADRPMAIAQLEREQSIVSAMPGCVSFRAFCSREDDTGITLLHEWIDQVSFAEYLASDAFARSGDFLRPMMTGTPTSRRFRVELVETVA
jgi:quinol monooxygenase YgiN